MDLREFLSGASGAAPTRPGSPSTGYATSGNPGAGVPPTVPGPYWFHQIAEELRAVIVAGGLTPNAASLTQLLTALQALFSITVLSTAGVPYGVKLGVVLVQWGHVGTSDVNVSLGAAYADTSFIVVVGNTNSQGSNNDNAFAYPVTAGSIYVGTKASGGGVSSYPVSWITIGKAA